ncbi:cell division protein ZipA [Allochromatium vinosum]|uniref:Cell division protein ZipA n=1 Tax=Allochromatium vinosum (strain ATCC 17899 / DSM 180 / NBRC 103801 / NCIMB 10441 / D) TaxID=572477 RepID=D3RSW1_ALLVD|nr:cell division protein ZipA [Allochromatium vinosum]ADC62270.1 cell division protein ZipA [Allochromatium vinosum DSM 180]
MDASTIRLILIVIGAILIVALYLWERHRERQGGYHDDYEDDYLVEDEGADEPYGVRPSRHDPAPDRYEAAEPPPVQEPPAAKPARSKSWLRSRISPEPDVESSPEPGRVERMREPEPMPDEAEDIPEPKTTKPAKAAPAASSAPKAPKRREVSVSDPLLIQLSVSARRYPFKGPEILEVAAGCGLYPGEMDIFHCLDEFEDETRVYFSMANMVKPGRFPFDEMDGFSTPGLVLFAQLEGDPEDMTILDEMVATARKLALSLNGDVLDAARRPLTVKKEEELRQAVTDNELRWKRTRRR